MNTFLTFRKTASFRLPYWAQAIEDDDSFIEFVIFSLLFPTNTKLLARLKAGFFIRDILERFTMKKDSTLSPDRSLWIYSAHDMTMIHILNALNLFEVIIQFLTPQGN